jgi:tetratricopeptide (TPR) repeat protein
MRNLTLAIIALLFFLCPTSGQSPSSAADYLEQGLARAKAGDLDGAIAAYNKAIELDADSYKARLIYFARANSRRHKGDLDGAIADFNKAIELDPDYAYAYGNRGLARRQKGDLDGAIADYSKAIELNPRGDQTHLDFENRGLARKEKGDLDGAIADYSKAIELDPDGDRTHFVYNNRGLAKKAKGDIEGALDDYNRAIELKPGYATAYYNRGDAERHKEELDRAIADYSRAIELKPDYGYAYGNRGISRKAKGDLDGAIADYDKAIQLNAKDVEAYIDFDNRGDARRIKGNLEGAREDLDEAIRLNAYYAIAFLHRAWVNLYSANNEGAVSDSLKYLELKGVTDEHSPYMVIVGYLAQRKASNSNADNFLAKWSRRFNPSEWSSQVMKYLSGALSAEELLQLAGDNDKKTEAHAYIGMVLSLSGNHQEALRHLKWVRERGTRTFFEYELADYEIRRIEATESSPQGTK